MYNSYSKDSNLIIDKGRGNENDFLQQITLFIQDNLQNQEVGVPEVCRHVGMSKSVLYKKLRTVSGMTINDFVRIVRFSAAAGLLKDRNLTIQEVALLVGYENRKYFSKEFKKHYGKNPSEYSEALWLD